MLGTDSKYLLKCEAAIAFPLSVGLMGWVYELHRVGEGAGKGEEGWSETNTFRKMPPFIHFLI